jgi:hypothetical protein
MWHTSMEIKDMQCHHMNNLMAWVNQVYISNSRIIAVYLKYIQCVINKKILSTPHIQEWNVNYLTTKTFFAIHSKAIIFEKSGRKKYSCQFSSWWALFLETCLRICKFNDVQSLVIMVTFIHQNMPGFCNNRHISLLDRKLMTVKIVHLKLAIYKALQFCIVMWHRDIE